MSVVAKRAVRFVVFGAIGIAMLTGAVYSRRVVARGAGTSDDKNGKGGRVVPVLTAKVEQRDVPVWLEGLGSISAWQQVTVRPQVDGRLDKVYFQEGQTVKRGDLLAQIDPRPFEVQLHQAEGALARDRAQLQSTSINLERNTTLRKTNLIAQQAVDDQQSLVGQAQGAVKIDEAQVESAKLNLDYARVRAPVDGVVGVRLVDAGNLVHATDTTGLVVITQIDPIALFVTLPQDELGALTAAQRSGPVTVEARSRDGKEVLGKGTLVAIDNQINTATSTLRLKAQVKNVDRKFWPNQFVKARILVDTRKNALVFPAAAVQRGPQGTFVYVVGADKTAVMKPIEVVLVTGDQAIVTGGIDAGADIVIEGQAQLRPGAQVAPRDRDAPALAADDKGAGAGIHKGAKTP